MKILVTGLCTLHWGRLEYGNVGNYYIVEPLFRELYRVFPEAEIYTTFQMTADFVGIDTITVLPMDLYYGWNENDVDNARAEYESVLRYGEEIPVSEKTEYIKVVETMDMVLDVSGDMWGDNAEHVGAKRFLVDLYKMRVAQLLGKKTVLFAVTPGPFYDNDTKAFAKEVFENFSMVENREPTSTANMIRWGFAVNNVGDFACPAFLYSPGLSDDEKTNLASELPFVFGRTERKICGFTIGGFNLPIGPYDMWPREEWQYDAYVECIEHIINDLHMRVVLFSHTNGFELPPKFKLINGRDYRILQQLYQIIIERGRIKNTEDICIVDRPYVPRVLKCIVGQFDMVVTGRVHASVAAISQCVPTVFINYEESFIPSTKMYGFADLAGVGEFVSQANDSSLLIEKVNLCYDNLNEIKERLKTNIPLVKQKARDGFEQLKKI